jgi:hypothetical protein
MYACETILTRLLFPIYNVKLIINKNYTIKNIIYHYYIKINN